MLQHNLQRALEAALVKEFKTDWPGQLKKIDTAWLAERLAAFGYHGYTIEKISDTIYEPGSRVLKAWADHRAAQILEEAEKRISEILVQMLDDDKPAPPPTGKEIAEIHKEIDRIDAERAHLTGRVNAAESKVSGVNGSIDLLRQRFSENLGELNKIKEDMKLRDKQFAELAHNLTASINSLTVLQKENENIREYIRQLQRKIWPRGVPAAYRIAADRKETKRSPRKAAAK